MRAALLSLLLLLLVGGGAFFWLRTGGAGGVLAPGGGAAAVAPAGASAAAALPDGVVATRTEPPPIAPGALADAPTVCLRVVDHVTSGALAGAAVRRVQTGADLGFSDERGLAPIPLAEPAQLAVVLDGYLLRLAPAQLGSSEQAPQEVRLVPDRWSFVRRFAFVDGRALDDVFVRLRPLGATDARRAPVPQDDPVLRRAWQEHTMLAGREVARDVAVQLGEFAVDRVHRLTGEVAVVRFIAAGDYELEAATTTGLVGAARFPVLPGAEPPVREVRLLPGHVARGRVLATDGSPLAAAEVTVQGGEPLGLLARTGADGGFALGPLRPGEVTLLVRHGLHEPTAVGPVATTTGDVVVRLTPLANAPLRGRVRARPDGAPVAGARVIWQVAGGAAVVVTSAADGTFELQARGDVAARLMVQADGFVPYAELVDPDAPFMDYDLLPADPRARVAAGLSALFEGVVFGPDGAPLPDRAVRWDPAAGSQRAPAAPAPPGRRILDGGALELPGVTTTDDVGAFVLETTRFGPGALLLAADPATRAPLTAVAGENQRGIELRR